MSPDKYYVTYSVERNSWCVFLAVNELFSRFVDSFESKQEATNLLTTLTRTL